MRIAVLQCELSHLHTPPHIGPSLIVQELEARGHQVRRFFVHVTRLEELASELRAAEIELCAIDSIFPLDVVRRWKERLGATPVVVGGLNALPLFEQAPLEFAILGPARAAMAALAEALDAAGGSNPNLEPVPNLLFRRAPSSLSSRIEASGTTHAWSLEREILPYAPPLEWEYRGPSGRHPMADRLGVSILPEFGCPYQSRAPLPPQCADDGVTLRPAAYDDRAWQRVREIYLDDVAACTFCVFRYQPFDPTPTASAVETLMEQVSYLWPLGVRSFAIQSENPFRFVEPLLDAMRRRGWKPEEIRLRTMVSVLKAQETRVEEVLRCTAAAGVRVSITQVGFESFVDRTLALFHKGVTSHENRRIARFLRRLDRAADGRIRTVHGHGLILFDPWTTLEELETNLEAIEADAPFLKRAVNLDAKLYLYSPYTPIARVVRAAGLLTRSDYEFGYDFDYADPDLPIFRDLCARGFAPLLEAIGRRRLEPQVRRRLSIEGRFRWFRELAGHIRAQRANRADPERGWSPVLAEVIRGLGLEG
ncbi:MAG: hypothetical protein IT349_05785 [Candidatus Eisenbacteria bacterium]|nr:hypothetical protein [Candidatus Eisenbacteria bacterium]